ncbi:Rop family plasmid primer RNA-binding protein [Serratia bockelmannii]
MLLEKLDILDLDEDAAACEKLHEAAEALYRQLETRFDDEEHQSDKSG